MKVKANRTCGIFDKEYVEGEVYDVPISEGEFLIRKEGFVEVIE